MEAGTKNWRLAVHGGSGMPVKAKADSEASGKIVDHVDNYFLTPTEYSRLK